MKSEPLHNLFERLSDEPFASAGIRPGGLGLTQRGLAIARLAPGDAALDVGCGTGVTVEFLIRERSIRALGIDSSSVLVSQGKARKPGLPLFLGDAEALPFADESFEGVLLECALSLVRDRARVLRECHRVLKPPGRIIVTDVYAGNPDTVSELRRLSIHSCLRGALDKNQFSHELSAAGFGNALFEDHSELLRDFAVQMIWAYGSLEPFWSGAASCAAASGHVHSAVRRARPGYFLCVGSKTGSMRDPAEDVNT
jgi:arsenite methyltransferase